MLKKIQVEFEGYKVTLPIELLYAIDAEEGTEGNSEEEKNLIAESLAYALDLNKRSRQVQDGDPFCLLLLFDEFAFDSCYTGPSIYQPNLLNPLKLLLAQPVYANKDKDVKVVYDRFIIVMTLPQTRENGTLLRFAMYRHQLPSQDCVIAKAE